MQVYILEGLGFGDDENTWERCSVHATREEAEAARTKIIEEGSCEPEWLRIVPDTVL